MPDTERKRMRRRLEELLAQRATEKLSREAEDELGSLLDAFPDADAEAFDRVAAAVWLAAMPVPEAMPARLRERIVRTAAVTGDD